MGYPDGIKGWRLRDCATGAFFNSRDVIGFRGGFIEVSVCTNLVDLISTRTFHAGDCTERTTSIQPS